MEQNNPKLSIIVPIYNVEGFVRTTLDCIINQTYQNLEIICVNDGSTDCSRAILEEYKNKDPRISIIDKENGGLASARNAGLEVFTGDYIAFLDSDDWLELNFYEKLIVRIQKDGSDVAVGETYYYYAKDKINTNEWVNYYNFKSGKDVITEIEDKRTLIYGCACWNKIYNAQIIRKYGLKFPHGLWIEDVPFTFAFAMLSNKISLVRGAILYYRQQENSVMAKAKNNRTPFDIFEIYKCCENFLANVDINAKIKKDYKYLLEEFEIFNIYSWSNSTCEKYKDEFFKLMKDKFKTIRIKNNHWMEDASKKIHKSVLQAKNCENLNKLMTKENFSFIERFNIKSKNEKMILDNTFKDIYWRLREQQNRINYLIGKSNKQQEDIECLTQKAYKQNETLENLTISNALNSYNYKSLCKKENNEPVSISSNNQNKETKEAILNLGNFYFMPNRGNLGDVIIANSEYQYFDSLNINFKPYDKEPKEGSFNLVYGGGGIWTPYYDYKNVLDIFKNPKIEKAVILPSSFYNCDDLFDILDERFTVFCREEKSYNYCISKNNKAEFYLADDMALGLNLDFYKQQNTQISYNNTVNYEEAKNIYNNIYKNYKKVISNIPKLVENKDFVNGRKIGYFLRGDVENNVDWSMFGITPLIDISQLYGSHCQDKSFTKILSNAFLSMIDSVDIVVTDRLHVGICGFLLNKPVLLVDNKYGKNSSVYNYSMKGRENIFLVTPDSIKTCLESITKTCNITNKEIFNASALLDFEKFLEIYLNEQVTLLENIMWATELV